MKRYIVFVLLAFGSISFAQESLWEMPECSWSRKMGDRPVYASTKIYESPGLQPATMTKKGMPVGGIGTGSFMYNLSGSFGPFHMKPGIYEERYLKQAAFHIREERKGETVGYTLATEDVLPAWNRLQVGDADYKALFPKATFDYHVFQSKVSLLYFSPVIRDNYKETSYPVAMFLFKVKNEKPEPVTLSLMFTFPNAPLVEVHDTLCGKSPYRPCRHGLYNRVIKNKQYTSVLLGADDVRNVEETQQTAWSIATSAKATYVDLWDGAGDGSDVWNDFMRDGRLSNKALCTESATPSGALCVTLKLKAGEEAVVPFALSWYFPFTTFGEGAIWKKRYTEYFPDNTNNEGAVAVAAEGLKAYPRWLEEVDAWVRPFAENKNCPDWLKAGALNELYYNTFGGSFWENGCVNQEKRFGNRPGQHISGVMECTAYPYLETFDVRHHAARVTRDLWPKIEKDILLTYSDIIESTTLGSCTHDLGKPRSNPVNNPDGYVLDYRKGKGKETTPWSEFSPKFIQQVFMYWKQYGDDAFLDDCWLAIVRSFHYQVATDIDNDGITEMTSSEYVDNKLLNAVLWITSLEALKDMAMYRNDKEMEVLAGFQLAKARKNTEIQFWNEELGYYQYNQEIPFLMADAFVGQRCADVFGLPAVGDEKRILSHFHQCFDRLVKPLRDYDGDGIGDLGAANILNPQGEPGIKTSEHRHEYEVWTGVSYNLAASMYHWGRKMGDKELMRKALLTGKGNYMQSWLVEENGFWFSTPEAYWFTDMPKARGNMYQRVRGIWELMMEVSK
ncbi:non-lysosomal glucosylceramidase [Parabacteroides sp. OttesenSCG-928-K15]|nr:non-lysosomal glucosylceramidase [Parabacteroides sp. OttesenSCG-928-K15]